jgi:hypothetical protein
MYKHYNRSELYKKLRNRRLKELMLDSLAVILALAGIVIFLIALTLI